MGGLEGIDGEAGSLGGLLSLREWQLLWVFSNEQAWMLIMNIRLFFGVVAEEHGTRE